MKINQKKAGVILSYLSQLVHILTGIIYTPIMLHLLGQSEYGLYQLVYSVVSYLSLLSLGFGAGYMRFYAREKVAENQKGIARLNGMFMLIFSIISVITMLCGAVMVFNIRHIFGSGLSDAEYDTAIVLVILMIINLALTFPNSVFSCIILSQERFLFQKGIIFLQYLLNPFLTFPLLLMGYGSIGMVSVTTFLTFAVLISNIFYSFKKLDTKFCFKELKFSLLKEMWVFTFFIFLNQIVDQINWSVDKFLLGRMAGTMIVAVYGIGSQINALYVQFSTSVSSVFVPKINKIVAETNDNKELTRLFTKVGRIQFIIMSLILTGFTFFGKPFIYYWAGPGYEEAYYVSLLLVFPVTVPLIQNLGIEIQRAKNKHKARSVVYFFIAIANIFLSIPLIRIWGCIGAAIGTAVALIVGNNLFMNWYYHFRLGIDIVYYWKEIIKFIPSLIPCILLGILNMNFIVYDHIWKLVLGIAVYTILYMLSIYLWGMNKEEKEMLVGPMRKIKKRFQKKDGKFEKTKN